MYMGKQIFKKRYISRIVVYIKEIIIIYLINKEYLVVFRIEEIVKELGLWIVIMDIKS